MSPAVLGIQDRRQYLGPESNTSWASRAFSARGFVEALASFGFGYTRTTQIGPPVGSIDRAIASFDFMYMKTTPAGPPWSLGDPGTLKQYRLGLQGDRTVGFEVLVIPTPDSHLYGNSSGCTGKQAVKM